MLRYWPLKYIFSFPWSVFLSNCFRILITGCPLTSAKQRSKGEQKFIKAVQQDTWLVVPDVLPILAFLCFSFQVLASHPLPQSQCPEVHRSWRTIFIKKKTIWISATYHWWWKGESGEPNLWWGRRRASAAISSPLSFIFRSINILEAQHMRHVDHLNTKK